MSAPTGDRWRALALTAVLCVVTNAPYLSAALAPPAGRVFAGTFHWIDDFCNYASYVQQAESGRFLFDDKLSLTPRRPVLANLEWWTVGLVSRLLGRSPFLAYRLFAVAATAALVAMILLWLRTLGVPAPHRTAAAALVCFGGGMGGVLFDFTDRPAARCPDLAIGFYPFLALLSQPHWTAATALLLAALWAFWRARTVRGNLAAIALGTALGLVRPYDLVLLVGVRVLAVVTTTTPRRWPARLLPLAGLAPVVGYLAWVFFGSAAFAAFGSSAYAAIPLPPLELLQALGPPALCLLAWRRPRRAVARGAEAHLAAWLAVGTGMVLLRPVSFSLQFAVGLGLPLLLLAARALARWAPSVTALTAIALGSSAFVAHRTVWRPDPNWFVPAERRDVVLALRPSCESGGLLLSPPDMGLFAVALTSCRSYVSHPAAAGYAERSVETAEFYGSGAPAARLAWLDRRCITHVVLPGDPASAADVWLGGGSGFRPAAFAAAGPSHVTAYVREPPQSCPPAAR